MIDSWMGIPEPEYVAYGERMGVLINTEKLPTTIHRYDSPAGAAACVPGGNTRGPMHDLGRFYQMLLAGGQLDGVRVLREESVQRMTSQQRTGMFDESFRHTMDWGLGLILDSNQYGVDTVPYGYGRYSSARSFGHGGASRRSVLLIPIGNWSRPRSSMARRAKASTTCECASCSRRCMRIWA